MNGTPKQIKWAQDIGDYLERAGVDDYSIEARANIVHLPRRYAVSYDRLPVIWNWAYVFDLEERRAAE